MDNRSIAIKLSGVKKQYRLGSVGGRTLQADLQSWWARLRGKPDPNLPIGQDERLVGQSFMALNGIDLTIYKGEACGIIGMNGAGKSTLLKLLAQITAPTEGEIDIYGRIASMLEIGTGFHGEMTGRENIYLNGAILGMTKSEIDAKIEDIIEFSEIRDFIDTPVKRYSSGMFVKLAFSVAAHLSNEIMIMDEVLAVGDMAFQEKCLDRMRNAANVEGRTVLYVSHNMNTIRSLCQRCIVLDQGRLIYDGDVDQAIAVYMNHSLKGNDVDIDLTSISHSLIDEIDTGLKMEHLTLVDKDSPIYASDQELEMDIALTVTKAFPQCCFRITLRTDSDLGLGTSWSTPIDLSQPGKHLLKLKMPLSSIAKGTLFASIGFYKSDELGRKIILDHITRAFKITVTGLPIWNTSAHGFISFPDTQLVEDKLI